jgi:hypothetical protein
VIPAQLPGLLSADTDSMLRELLLVPSPRRGGQALTQHVDSDDGPAAADRLDTVAGLRWPSSSCRPSVAHRHTEV